MKPTRSKYVGRNRLLVLPEKFDLNHLQIVPHTPACFNLSKLSFDYDPSIECPLFEKILAESLVEQEKIDLLWEWFGYNLIYDTRMAKSVILLGEGANGKSVIMTVLGQLIGENNFSSISLDAFDPKRTFMLAATKGKLSNLCEDMNEINKVAEGMLKSFISGGKVEVEEKHKPPYALWPTARLTFATNSLPRFVDGTDGIFRRFLVLEFPNQILDESKQNKNYIDPKWWTKSGELPGILNKSLLGLQRLMERCKFLEPASSKAVREKYRDETNSGRLFLRENYEKADNSTTVFSSDLYENYRNFCADNGYAPKGAAKFQEDIRRLFPEVERSKSMRKSPKTQKRSYTLSGLREKLIVESDNSEF